MPSQRNVKDFEQKSFGGLAGGCLANTVGERLAQARRLFSFVVGRDVSQDDLAIMAGLAKGSMSQWEKGHKRPSRDTIQRIVNVLHQHGMTYITVAWIDYGEGSGPPILGSVPREIEIPEAPRREVIPLAVRRVPRVKKRPVKKKGSK